MKIVGSAGIFYESSGAVCLIWSDLTNTASPRAREHVEPHINSLMKDRNKIGPHIHATETSEQISVFRMKACVYARARVGACASV